MAFDQTIASMTVFMEASGEGYDGMRAVAHVLFNRYKEGWAETLAEVCLAPLQFSCWNTDDPNRERIARIHEDDPILQDAVKAVTDAAHGPDPTFGATNYYADSLRRPPEWAGKMVMTARIGHHVFLK